MKTEMNVSRRAATMPALLRLLLLLLLPSLIELLLFRDE
jgi:hypothetical protein